MASSSSFLLFAFSTAFAFISSISATDPKPPVVLPVRKDAATLQYYTTFGFGSPSYKLTAVIDVGGPFLWFNCDNSRINSSSYHAVECNTNDCSAAGGGISCLGCSHTPRLGCANNTCGTFPYNPINDSLASGGLWKDDIALGVTSLKVSNFLFACGLARQLHGLIAGAQGMLGLGRTQLSLQTQISSAFNVPPKFALCAPSSAKPGRFGAIVFGGGPYYMTPYPKDIWELLVSTPLILNSVSTAPVSGEGETSSEYFIVVNSIHVDGKIVSFNSSLLSFNKDGVGGTKISTVTPYTVLHSNIYKALVKEFVKSATLKKIARVASVAPFGACFASKTIRSTRTGPDVPVIDLALLARSGSVNWRICGANSMVSVKKDVVCLGFVDGGSKPRTSIVIGGHQLEDNLLEFDLGDSMLRFSTSLLLQDTRCSHFRSG